MTADRVQLGQFILDVSRYELTRAGTPVRMERIPMDLLILLVREGGRLVSREEIIERLWGKEVYFDTDNSINTAIRKIRRALGEDPERPQYIETVQGKGYRFKWQLRERARIATRALRPMPTIRPPQSRWKSRPSRVSLSQASYGKHPGAKSFSTVPLPWPVLQCWP